MKLTRIVTRNSVTWSFSTTRLSSETHAPLIPWTVSDAFAIPAFAASAKLVGDDAVISITFATLIGASSVGDWLDSRTPARGWASGRGRGNQGRPGWSYARVSWRSGRCGKLGPVRT